MPVLVVSNQKGGVGKTTTVTSLAWYLATAGKRTLVVDNDPQGNATSCLAPTAEGGTIYDGQAPIATATPDLFVIPGGPALLDQERILAQRPGGHGRMRELLAPLKGQYGPIVIDCPPNLSFLPTNALLSATHLLVPLQCEYYALEGLGQLLAYIDDLRRSTTLDLRWVGILLTMADDRSPLAAQIEREVRAHFGPQVLQTVIPRDPALAAAPSHGRTVAETAPLSRGSLAYLDAAREILDVLV